MGDLQYVQAASDSLHPFAKNLPSAGSFSQPANFSGTCMPEWCPPTSNPFCLSLSWPRRKTLFQLERLWLIKWKCYLILAQTSEKQRNMRPTGNGQIVPRHYSQMRKLYFMKLNIRERNQFQQVRGKGNIRRSIPSTIVTRLFWA